MYKWILGNLGKDFLGILLPGFVGIVLSFVLFGLQNDSDRTWFTIGSFVIFGVIDAGHVYLTMWRTWLYEVEWKSSFLNWLVPSSIALIMAMWIYFGVPYLWRFTLYFTVYHHIRQFYGIQKWYQHLYKRSCRWSSFFLYALTILPFVLLHFRQAVIDGYYTKGDLFIFENREIYNWLWAVYIFFLVWWLSFEVHLFFKVGFEGSRVLQLSTTVILCGSCFLLSKNNLEVVVPLMISHGVSYLALMELSLKRLKFPPVWGIRSPMILLLLTALILGGGTFWMEYEVLDINNRYLNESVESSSKFLLALYFVPLYSHYIFDSFIWKKNHRDGKLIYV